jgi:uncharacterized protein YciI
MFVVDLEYIRPVEEVDAHMAAHRAWLEQHYAAGTFLASGPKEPRSGGVILASAPSREALDAILADDPFQVHGLAKFEVTQFTVRTAGKGLDALVGS